VDAPGDAPGKLSRRGHSRPCRRSWCRHVSVLQRPVKPRRPIFWCERRANRRIEPEAEPHTHLLDEVRAWKAPASRPFHVPGSHGRTARSTVVQLAYGALTVLPPRFEKRFGKEPLRVWAIRVWEEQTPDGEEPLEWLLLTSVSTTTLEQGCRARRVV
jgi:hypothetical protein